RRAERGGVHARVTQASLRDAIQCRRRNHATESAWRAEPDVIGHDQQDVGRLLWRHDARCPPRFRLESIVLDHATEFRIGRGTLFAVNGCRGTRRTELTADLPRERGRDLEAKSGAHTRAPKEEKL